MNTIEINNSGIKVNVSVFLFKEDDVFHAYCPELDLVGYDYTEEGAKKSFEYVLKDYLDYTVENGTLEQDLMNHGWRKSKTGKVSEPTASSLLRRSQLKKVLSKREFNFRRFLFDMGCTRVEQGTKGRGGHEKWTKPGLMRPITIQTHVDPVPELIIRNTLSNLGKTKKDFFEWYYKK